MTHSAKMKNHVFHVSNCNSDFNNLAALRVTNCRHFLCDSNRILLTRILLTKFPIGGGEQGEKGITRAATNERSNVNPKT